VWRAGGEAQPGQSREEPGGAAGDEEEETFKGYRLSYGIYGQRQAGYQMVRVKIPHGRLSSTQLEALASFSELFCDQGDYPGGGGRGRTSRSGRARAVLRARSAPGPGRPRSSILRSFRT